MIKTIYSFVFVAVSMLILTPLVAITVLFSLLGLRKPMSVFMYRVAQGWAKLLICVVGAKLTVRGKENIPRKGGVCFVCNHGSFFDIPVLLANTGRPFGFVAKKELVFVPLVNMYIAVLGGLFIDRKNVRRAIQTINKGVGRIKAGGGMLIFPEGHRSRDQGLLPFHSGSLKLATQAETVIVPVALKGTYSIFEKKYRVTAGPVSITFCKPINTADIPVTDRKQILAEQIYAVIDEALKSI